MASNFPTQWDSSDEDEDENENNVQVKKPRTEEFHGAFLLGFYVLLFALLHFVLSCSEILYNSL